jgi:predicted Zn-dependent protease with MMP-like domain
MAVRVGEERFSELVREALSELPSDFAKYLRGLEIQGRGLPG